MQETTYNVGNVSALHCCVADTRDTHGIRLLCISVRALVYLDREHKHCCCDARDFGAASSLR